MAGSRQELLAWLNDEFQLNVTKVEQCGTGAAFCQIYDSIWRDVPMSKVKFDTRSEVDYRTNFKHLQSCFVRHGVDRTIDIEALVRCKMQDNLEFLQWTRNYWETHCNTEIPYDPVARRKGSSAPPASGPPAVASARTSGAGAARRGTTPTTTSAARTGSRTVGKGGSATPSALKQDIIELKEIVAGLEKERDFYFSKLRDIEMILQRGVEADPTVAEDEDGLIKHILNSLYSTEEGFEIPAEGEAEIAEQDDLETF